MGNIEHQLVLRGIKNIVERDYSLRHAEIRTAVSSVDAELVYERDAHFRRESLHLVGIQLLNVGG